MEGDFNSSDASLRIQEEHRVEMNSDLTVRDIVEAHEAKAGAQQLTPLADIEGGYARAVLGGPHLVMVQNKITYQFTKNMNQAEVRNDV